MSLRFDDFPSFLHAMQGKRLLYLGHKNADCDALGSAYAISRILPGDLGFAVGLIASARDLARWLDVNVIIDPDPAQYDYTVICDAFIPELLALPLPLHYSLFDHHIANGHRFGEFENKLVKGAEWAWVQPFESTCSLLVDLFQEHHLAIDAQMAMALACGIITDTGMLRHASAPALRRLGMILEPAGFYIEDVLSVIDSPARRSARRSLVLDAVCSIDDVSCQNWSILTAMTDSLDHGMAVLDFLNHLGGDVRIVGFPRDGKSMVMSECHPSLVETAGMDMLGLMQQISVTIIPNEVWGTRLMGRIIAPLPVKELLSLCAQSIVGALSSGEK